jgi:hypothetical protein
MLCVRLPQVMKAVFVFLILSTLAEARTELVEKIWATRELPAWNTALTKISEELLNKGEYPTTGLTRCAETQELPGAFLCASMKKTEMNQSLARASTYVEGLYGEKKGTVVTHGNFSFLTALYRAGGHDLRSEDLKKFYQEVEVLCFTDKTFCLSEQEREFFKEVVSPLFRQKKDFVILAYAIQSEVTYQQVVTHEIMHAQYFLQPAYREICDKFWEESVSEEDKATIKSLLSKTYNVEDPLLLRNEFQAYLLMGGGEHLLLGKMVPKYRDNLIEKLNKIGLAPIQIP